MALAVGSTSDHVVPHQAHCPTAPDLLLVGHPFILAFSETSKKSRNYLLVVLGDSVNLDRNDTIGLVYFYNLAALL